MRAIIVHTSNTRYYILQNSLISLATRAGPLLLTYQASPPPLSRPTLHRSNREHVTNSRKFSLVWAGWTAYTEVTHREACCFYIDGWLHTASVFPNWL